MSLLDRIDRRGRSSWKPQGRSSRGRRPSSSPNSPVEFQWSGPAQPLTRPVPLAPSAAMALTAAIVLLLAGAPTVVAQDLPTADSLVQAAQENMRVPGYEAVTRLLINDGRGNERVRQIAIISGWFDAEQTEKRLMRFLSPPDVAGTGLLVYDHDTESDDMWLYLPALRRSRRLASTEKSGSFMGSEFTYADMTALSMSDFEYRVLRREEVRGRQCYVLEQVPASTRLQREYGFVRREIALLVDAPVIWQSDYYDARGRISRTLTVTDVEAISEGHYRPTVMRMENKQNGRSSQMITDQHQVSESVSEEYFTVRYLENP